MSLKYLSLEIRILANQIYKRLMMDGAPLPSMHQCFILQYVVSNPNKNISQKEIEELFSIRRSTANHMLQLLEKDDYIKRETSSDDARVKIIKATQKGIEASKYSDKCIKELEDRLCQGISHSEIDNFRSTMRKLWNNIDCH